MRTPLPVVALLLAAACSDGPGQDSSHVHDGHDHGDAIAAACEALAGAAAGSIAAANDPLAAPPIAFDHRRTDVALFDYGDGTFGGAIAFESPAEGNYVLFVAGNARVVVEGPGGALVVFHSDWAGAELCPETITAVHTIPMSAGPHTISFGPTVDPTIGVVIERGEPGHVDGHG